MMVSEHNHVKVLAVHFTKACSHQCSFCYASASSSKKHVAPNHATLIKVIEAAAASNVEELVFLGGDPCTYSKLLQLCEAAHSNNMTTTVLSNTHVYQTDDVRTVTQLVDCFETTLHGPSPNEHDTIALSEGAFDKVLTNLGRLATSARSMGIAYNITPHNCRHLVDTVEHAIDRRGLPIDHLLVQRIIPQGRGRTTSKFSIGCTHAVAALEQIERLSTRYHSLRVSFEDAFPFCVIPQRFHKYLNRCEWGFSRASVDNRGNLSRCGADPRYRLGNILRTPLDQIWNTSDILAQFRSRKYLPQDCQNCALLTSCGGGCALSCEIEKDHGPDYLYFERAKIGRAHV
jgi:radical SAM protein with 4Fe4S-binding SPASM domain